MPNDDDTGNNLTSDPDTPLPLSQPPQSSPNITPNLSDPLQTFTRVYNPPPQSNPNITPNLSDPLQTITRVTRREVLPQDNPEKNRIVNAQPRPSGPMDPNRLRGGGNRNAHRVSIMGDGLRDWSFGLFECMSDLPTCLRATIAPCYVYSTNRQRLDHLEIRGEPFHGSFVYFNHECMSYALLQFFNAGWALQAITRHDVRRRYGIRGDGLHDVLASGLCIPCGLVQEHREIGLEESSFEI
ncbi:PLAC8 family-domain-containing protein [Russula dissimulans]|nr:PLAC8 family-domain-containing protein [Russula dissimulans]